MDASDKSATFEKPDFTFLRSGANSSAARMQYLNFLIDFILHTDVHLNELIRDYGALTYAILFAIIFVETGLVIMPLLPRDSLLFAAGAFSANGDFDLRLLETPLSIGAIGGDSLNYAIGRFVGPRAFTREYRWLNRQHLRRTEVLFSRHGGKTIIMARFGPIVRTFAPFVAGVGAMSYSRFLLFNVVGGLAWIWGVLLLGYFFGTLPVVKENSTTVIPAIILVSLLPIIIELVRNRRPPA